MVEATRPEKSCTSGSRASPPNHSEARPRAFMISPQQTRRWVHVMQVSNGRSRGGIKLGVEARSTMGRTSITRRVRASRTSCWPSSSSADGIETGSCAVALPAAKAATIRAG